MPTYEYAKIIGTYEMHNNERSVLRVSKMAIAFLGPRAIFWLKLQLKLSLLKFQGFSGRIVGMLPSKNYNRGKNEGENKIQRL